MAASGDLSANWLYPKKNHVQYGSSSHLGGSFTAAHHILLMLDLIMKCSYIILLIALFPNPTFSDTIFLKDGTNFSTSIYWEESKGKIGYFRDGKSIYISKDLIDWNKTEEKRTLIKTNKSNIESSYFSKTKVTKNSLLKEMNMYLKAFDIIIKYGSPETLSETNNDRWVAYFPKGDFTIITDKGRNKILRVISGKGFQQIK